MLVKKSFTVLISLLMFQVVHTTVSHTSTDTTQSQPLSDYKQQALALIAEAQAAYDQAERACVRLNHQTVALPVGISMSSMHRPCLRFYDLAATVCEIKRCERTKAAAILAVQACTRWHNGLEHWPAREQCHKSVAAFRALQR